MNKQSTQYDFVSRDKCCADISRYTVDLIRENGYEVETVEVCTDDGYFLTMFRMGKKDDLKKESPGKPVLLIHGLTQSSAEFVMEKQRLAYVLVDEGFDVWIGNCRGTTYSRKHRYLKDNSKEYWNYSFHEIGIYDLSKFIDHIQGATGYGKVRYIGVSQGCTTLSVLLSTRPEYNRKIEVACFLCPAMKFRHTGMSLMKIFFFYIAPFLNWIDHLFYGALQGDILSYLLRVFGLKTSKFRLGSFCNQLIWRFFAGCKVKCSKSWINFDLIFLTSPNTISLKQVVHFSQIIRGDRFTMFDYGTKKNEEIYKRKSPPPYDLSKISAPIALFYSKNDSCYGDEDIDNLSNELGNCVLQYVVEDENFDHFDFVYHQNAGDLLYKHILKLKEFSL